jgi:hypothetical protein
MSLIHNQLTVFLVTLMVVQLVELLSSFMKSGSSLPCSQKLITQSLPEADESSPHSHTLFLLPGLVNLITLGE